MNHTINFMASISNAIEMMNLTELREVINLASNQIDAKAEMHRIAIQEALSNATKDGFDISFWVEGTNDWCIMCHDDDRIKRISVN